MQSSANKKQIKKPYGKPLRNVTLARYGGLNLVNQKNNYGNDTFHSAPERVGMYAFVFPYIELFLIGSTREKEFKDGTYKKIHATDGFIWTHLIPTKQSMIVDVHNSWYKVRVSDLATLLKKAFSNEVGHQYANQIYGWGHQYSDKEKVRIDNSPKTKSPYAYLSKDHLEVFVTRETIFS